jgi:hypothetical protein
MTEEEKINKAKRIHEKARYFRGRFLNSVAVIERELAFILTDYFCTQDQEKRELFYKGIATEYFFSLKEKKKLLIKIVKKDYPNYWDNHKEILNNFDDMIEFRNSLAHSIIDVSNEALERSLDIGIGFVDWKAGEPISEEKFQDWEVKANMIISCLGDIKRLLPFIEKREK